MRRFRVAAPHRQTYSILNKEWNMMSALILALLAFLFPLAYSPGPGNMFFAANGARFGFWSSLWSNLGYHIATWIVTAAIGLGFMAAMGRFPEVFLALKIAGALYVLWIASKMFRAGMITGDNNARAAGFWDGVILLILNPKAYLIITLMFTQFLGPSDDDMYLTVLVITCVFTLNNLLAFLIWTALGDVIARRFRSPQSAKRLNMMFGTILALVAIWMLVS
jgi:threonine/homoserine/homoserine lactone efflux protein